MRVSILDPHRRLQPVAGDLPAHDPQLEVSTHADPEGMLTSADETDVFVLIGDDAPQIERLVLELQFRTSQPAIVFVHGSNAPDVRLAAIRLGVHECVPLAGLKADDLALAVRSAAERSVRERDLREQLQRMTTLLDNIPERVFFKDAESRFLQINRALALRFGLPDPAQAAGLSDADYFDAAHAESARADEQQVMDSGQPLLGQIEAETMPDGRTCWALTSKLPLRDSRGRIVGTFGISHDVTEWRLAEKEVRESEERYRRLLDSVTDYVYSVEVGDGGALSTRHGPGCLAVTGFRAEDFCNDSSLWYRIIHPHDREMVTESIRRLMETGEPSTIEHRLVRADGSVRWVRNKQAPKHGPQGEIVAYDGLISDITERKLVQDDLVATNARLKEVLDDLTQSHEELLAAQKQLIESEKFQAIGQLAAGVAHEVKNPLAILQVGIDFFSDKPHAAPEAEAVLGEMRKAVAEANDVITNLLSLSAEREADLRAIAINVVVQQALRLAEPRLAANRVELVTELGAKDHVCRVDPGKITHSLVQVLINACDAMPDGGTLKVATAATALHNVQSENKHGDRSGRFLREGDPVVVVEISDTGIGIPADKISRVFDPFFTTKRTGKGKGLGLSVAKGIVNLYRGEMSISSATGKGSTVTIVLPNSGEESSLP